MLPSLGFCYNLVIRVTAGVAQETGARAFPRGPGPAVSAAGAGGGGRARSPGSPRRSPRGCSEGGGAAGGRGGGLAWAPAWARARGEGGTGARPPRLSVLPSASPCPPASCPPPGTGGPRGSILVRSSSRAKPTSGTPLAAGHAREASDSPWKAPRVKEPSFFFSFLQHILQ